jgi:hypothetical protein
MSPPEPKRPHQIATIDEIEAIPGPDTLTWHPVRHHFGINAFGTNAYTAAEAGRHVVEPHDEQPDEGEDAPGHEELYFVATGLARFTINDETFDAPAGTYVFIPEPSDHRHAVAQEAGTTVLSFGGPPVFEPSAWEWAFRAKPYLRTDPERAREILEEGREKHPGNPGIAWSLARLHALNGDSAAALAELGEAIAADDEVKALAREHDDLASLRHDPEFQRLTA